MVELFEKSKKLNLLNMTKDSVFKLFFKDRLDCLKSVGEKFCPFEKGSIIEKVFLLNTELSSDQISNLGLDRRFVLDLRAKIRRMVNGVLQPPEMIHIEMQTTSQKYLGLLHKD